MGSKSRAGNDRFEREQYLRQHGFQLSRNGKGSHGVWENDAMKELALQPNFKLPENMKETTPWQVILCANPGMGTWKTLVHHVETVTQLLKSAADKQKDQKFNLHIRTEFNQKVQLYMSWKKNIRHELKAGVPLSEAPVSFREIENLRMKKQGIKLNT